MINFKFFLIAFLILCFGCSLDSRRKDNVPDGFKESKISPSYVPLKIGEITPEGWIRDWGEDALKGITGHLDEYSASIFEGWTGYDFTEVKGSQPGGAGWPLELSAHWLEGALNLSYLLKDTVLFNRVSHRLDKVVQGVLNGGETFVFWLPRKAVVDSLGKNDVLQEYNNWAHSIMGRTLLFYYQITGKKDVLKALVKVYKQFSPGSLPYEFSGGGSCNIEAMAGTYLLSGEESIRDSILSFSRRFSYRQVKEKWYNRDFVVGHGGGFYEMFRIPAMLYIWTGDTTDLIASKRAIEWGEKQNMLPMGICSGEEYLAGIGATRNVETCNISYANWAFLWMLRNTGDCNYADRIEKIFFNAAPAPVSRDYKIMCYYQSANRYNDSLPGQNLRNPGPGAYKYTKIGHPVQCCVANINRNIPMYVSNMWMRTPDNGLVAALYGPCRVKTNLSGKYVGIHCQTAYPFGENIEMTLSLKRDAEFPLYFRIPDWCEAPLIQVNGEKINTEGAAKRLVKILRKWSDDDKIVLEFPMKPYVLKGRETPYPQISYFDFNHKLAKDTTVNWPYECIYLGPLLFSYPIPDKTPNEEVRGAKFNYALDVNLNSQKTQIAVEKLPMPKKWDWRLEAPVRLKVKAKEFDWHPSENQPLPKNLIKGDKAVDLELVPYCCTKFRLTMFPVTEKSWNSGGER